MLHAKIEKQSIITNAYGRSDSLNLVGITDKYFPALKRADYRIFFIGQCFSLTGTWMQTVGQSWLVYQMTDSPLLLGVITALQFIPVLLFSLPVGAVIDRVPKKAVFRAVQILMSLNAFVLFLIVYFGYQNIWNVGALALFLGFLNCIDMPIRQSVMVEWAGKEHIMNAISLNAAVFNAARIIGPALAGIIFSVFGPATCFLINALSFIPIIIGSAFMKTGLKIENLSEASIFQDAKEGIVYIANHVNLAGTVLIIGIISTFALNFNLVVPVIAKTILKGDSSTFGFLMASLGTGAFIGAVRLAAISHKGFKISRIFIYFAGLGVMLIILGYVDTFLLAMITMLGMGFCMSTGLSSCNTFLQMNSPDKLRGRIMSVYSLVLAGVSPIGSMFSGLITEEFGIKFNMLLSGIIAISFMLIMYIKYYKKMSLNKVRR